MMTILPTHPHSHTLSTDSHPNNWMIDMFDASNLSSNAGDQQNVPKMKPTTPLMRSKTLAMRSRPRPKTDWKAEKTPLRMPERISTREEKRFERPLVREDIVGSFIVSLILRGWFWGGVKCGYEREFM